MRFKIFYNEQKEKVDINCLPDDYEDVILPDNLDQHVYFPIPRELTSQIKDHMSNLIDDRYTKELEAIHQQMIDLHEKRQSLIYELREKYNAKIIEECEKFKDENAEHFI